MILRFTLIIHDNNVQDDYDFGCDFERHRSVPRLGVLLANLAGSTANLHVCGSARLTWWLLLSVIYCKCNQQFLSNHSKNCLLPSSKTQLKNNKQQITNNKTKEAKENKAKHNHK